MIKYVILSYALLSAAAVQAHDPKEHMKDAKSPDCAAMKKMDHSKMDMDDPVTMALMKKCMKSMDMDMNHDTSDKSEKDAIGEKSKPAHSHR